MHPPLQVATKHVDQTHACFNITFHGVPSLSACMGVPMQSHQRTSGASSLIFDFVKGTIAPTHG